MRERHRHNSWHNLVQLEDDSRSHRHRPSRGQPVAEGTDDTDDDGANNLAKFMDKQDTYIRQLENENQYFRQQVLAVLK